MYKKYAKKNFSDMSYSDSMPCKCPGVNPYVAHAWVIVFGSDWQRKSTAGQRGTYPSSLIWQTKLRGGREGKEKAVRTKKWWMNQHILLQREGRNLGAINFE